MRLVTFDLDGTLLEGTVFQAAADGLGFGDELRAIDERFFAGELSLEETFEREVVLFEGRHIADVHRALSRANWVDNIQTVVGSLHAQDVGTWVCTDQPSWAVSFLEPWGLHRGVFSEAPLIDDRIGPVTLARFDKRAALQEALAEAHLDAADVCHVGNGANDVPVFELVGRSVAFNPDTDVVAQAADDVVNGTDLADVLRVIAPG